MKNILVSRLAAAGLAAIALLNLTSCTTAEVKDVWVAPGLTNIHFKKVLVIATAKDGATRRTFEDSLVAAMPRVQAVPGYAFLGDNADIKDAAKVSNALREGGFDGVVVVRMISDRTEVSSTSTGYPMGYGRFGGYYGGYAYGAGSTVTTDRILSIETNIYEFPSEKLIWSGVTESTSPGNIPQMVSDAVAAVRQQMIKQHLVPEMPKK